MSILLQEQYQHDIEALTPGQRLILAKKVAEHLGNNLKTKKTLVACIRTIDNQYPNIADIKKHLHSTLPEYFVPQEILPVFEIPRQAQGKLDRNNLAHYQWQLLPDSVGNSIDDQEIDYPDFVEPSNDIERSLAQIWCDVLGIGEISVHDEFIEVGGDSLLSIRILSRVKSAGYDVSPEIFFKYSTIYEQANWLNSISTDTKDKEENEASALPAIEQSELDLISSQLDELDED